jgi:hypothetical protein
MNIVLVPALLYGVMSGCADVPFHRIYLKSDLVSGTAVVVVRTKPSVEDVYFFTI